MQIVEAPKTDKAKGGVPFTERRRGRMITVFGSINVDLVCRVARTPVPARPCAGRTTS